MLWHQGRVYAIQSSANVHHLVEPLRLDRLVGHDAILVDRLPCHSGGFSVRYRWQRGDAAEKRREVDEIIGEGGLCAEVGWRRWDDTKGAKQLVVALSLVSTAPDLDLTLFLAGLFNLELDLRSSGEWVQRRFGGLAREFSVPRGGGRYKARCRS